MNYNKLITATATIMWITIKEAFKTEKNKVDI